MDSLKVFKNESKELLKLQKLADLCYEKIEDVEVELSKSREPVVPGKQYKLKYKKIMPGDVWAEHVFNCGWFHVTGQIPSEYAGKHVVLYMDIDGEGTIYEGTVPIAMITNRNSYEEELSPERGKNIIELSSDKIDLYLDGGFNGLSIMEPYGKGYFRDGYIAIAHDEYIDIFYDYYTASTYFSGLKEKEREETEKLLDEAFDKICSGNIEEAKAILDGIMKGQPSDFTFTAIGHSHLDLAWLWPVRETKRKAIRTFTKQLLNLEEYPDYVYGASQPWQFEQVKNIHPELFERIRKAVEEGRFEPQGGMYVESDTNLTSGESLIRQIHYGKDFFSKQFNQNMRICWLPDVFGYNGNLPQILKKSGIPYFFTIKLSWNEHNRFPYRSFLWKGIDGSDVLVHMSPNEDYNGDGSPIHIQASYENYPEKNISREAIYTYGIGDGGGGPSRAHIELLRRQKSLPGRPVVKSGKTIDFFDRLNLIRDKLPQYQGELYLEKHQGTYTTQARNKRGNRKMEYGLQNLEALAVFAMLKGYSYPSEEIDNWWKEVLLYQFHDIIPGSSINRVYKESVARYEIMAKEIEDKTAEILTFLAGKGEKEIIFNPISFVRKGISGWGFGTIQKENDEKKLIAEDGVLSNGILTARFNKDGEIISLTDADGKEYGNGVLNRFKLFYDRKLFFNAWDIDWKYFAKKGRTITAYKTEYSVDIEKATVTSHYRFGNSNMIQKVILQKGEDILRFNTEVNWHNVNHMLRTEFYTAADPDEVTCDIQLGRIVRSARDNTSIEQAQFEICAHKYVDLSDENGGFSLINDCKYGHRVKNGMISLNLLRSPVFPDPEADRGYQQFDYAIYPHTGSCDSRTAERGYGFNKPLRNFKGAEVPQFGFTVSNPETIIDTVKKSYEGNDIVIRMYENSGKAQDTALTVPFEYDRLLVTDLLEKNGISGEISSLHFKPYEIKTLVFVNPELK